MVQMTDFASLVTDANALGRVDACRLILEMDYESLMLAFDEGEPT